MKLKTVQLNKTSGKKTIAQATDLFYYIDSDFKNWGTDVQGKPTQEMSLEVHELTEDKTFAQIFTDPEKMCLTQEQIIEFCTNHKDQLRKDWYGNFFLFKVEGKGFFVAGADFDSDGRLGVDVDELADDYVWPSGSRHRFVLPQLAPSTPDTSEPLELSNFEDLALKSAIELCKLNGLTVTKTY